MQQLGAFSPLFDILYVTFLIFKTQTKEWIEVRLSFRTTLLRTPKAEGNGLLWPLE
jgi:hypothetical protein